MCLIFISLNSHPRYKLIVAANRDEFYARKTAPAGYWKDYPDIVGGRDLEASGTWMAMTTSGKISMVTNFRDPKNIREGAPSRGHLVTRYLTEALEPREYLMRLQSHASEYNGFNLLVGNPDRLFYYSNYNQGIIELPNGVHALSNHLLDTPWPKVRRVKRIMGEILTSRDCTPDQLLDALQDDHRAPLNELPATGVSQELEEALSSMFIRTPAYGTRCSTVVLVDRSNKVSFTERVYNTEDLSSETKTFQFGIAQFGARL